MTEKEVILFEKTKSQLQGLYTEISTLSKKSQNDALNKFKLKRINLVLQDCNILLGTKYKPFADFELFDEADIPTNSDGTLMLNQYLLCMEKLRTDNIVQDSFNYKWYWIISGKRSTLEA